MTREERLQAEGYREGRARAAYLSRRMREEERYERGETAMLWVVGAGTVAFLCWYLFRDPRTASAKGRPTVSAFVFAPLSAAPVLDADKARAAGATTFDDLPKGSLLIDPDLPPFGPGIVAPTALTWATAVRDAGRRVFVDPKKRGRAGRVVLLDEAPIEWPEVVA